jgi:prepilin-type N-terminal cleavage/methylation domain-containing protein
MLRKNRQGFTLIELMVVIVIIGVLASLAIPRFGEASARAKVAEAPRVIASWESAFLSITVEVADVSELTASQAPFSPPISKWWTYEAAEDSQVFTATTQKISSTIIEGMTVTSTFDEDVNDGCFERETSDNKLENMMLAFMEGGGC